MTVKSLFTLLFVVLCFAGVTAQAEAPPQTTAIEITADTPVVADLIITAPVFELVYTLETQAEPGINPVPLLPEKHDFRHRQTNQASNSTLTYSRLSYNLLE